MRSNRHGMRSNRSGLPVPNNVFYGHIGPRLPVANLARLASTSRALKTAVAPSLAQRKNRIQNAARALNKATTNTVKPLTQALILVIEAMLGQWIKPYRDVVSMMQEFGWQIKSSSSSRQYHKKVQLGTMTVNVLGTMWTTAANIRLVVSGFKGNVTIDLSELGVFKMEIREPIPARQRYVLKTAVRAAANFYGDRLAVSTLPPVRPLYRRAPRT